jgi:short-subunit dehydrogenase
MVDLQGKPIAITGASSGIGRATAIACARAGMPVALGARRRDKLDQLVEEISSFGGKAVAVPTDVTRTDDCDRLIDLAVREFGSIYAVFANAGFGLHKPVHETTDAELRAIFETNFFGTVNTVRPVLPHLLAAGRGHVLICSSCLAKAGTPLHGPYSATKAAQDHIARAMRIELKPRNIAVSSVHPVGTKTEFFAQAEANSGPIKDVLPGPPGMFMQSPDKVARAIVRNLRRGRGKEIWTSQPSRLAFASVDFFPSTADRVLGTAVRRMLRR